MKILHLISIASVSILLFASCNFESFEKRCAREAEEYTTRHCPRRMNKYTVMDSLTFNPETKTFGYYYTLEGDLDNDSIITNEIADSFREQLKKELINSVELKAYKEAKEVIEHFEWIVDGDKCYCYDCQEWDGETNSYKPKKKG